MEVSSTKIRLRCACRRPLALQTGLGDLDVPVANLVPEELLHAAGHVAKGVVLNALGDHLYGLGQAAEHPGVGRRLNDGLAGRVALHVHEQEAAGVPDLGHKALGLVGTRTVDELLGLLIDVRIELDVLVVGAQREQVIAHGVGAVHTDEVHGVNAVALGLGHAAAVLGQDRRVDDDVLKRHLVQEVQRAHDHAGNHSAMMSLRGDRAPSWDDGPRAAPGFCGQPCVAKVHSCELNQVSSTFSSWCT